MFSVATLPLSTTTERQEIYSYVLARYHGRENTHECISKCLSQQISQKQEDFRVLIIGPGPGDIELKLLACHKIDYLIAVEPSLEVAETLETNLRSSSSFIKKWNIERTKLESYLMNKNNIDGPFDIILMTHSVYYLPTRGQILRQVRSLLRPHTGQFIMVITYGCFSTITRKYIPESKHVYDADDLDDDLRDVGIPFKRYLTNVTLDLTDLKGNDKLEWAFASLFLEVNVANDDKNLTKEMIEDLLHMAETTKDGKLEIKFREDIFLVQPIDENETSFLKEHVMSI